MRLETRVKGMPCQIEVREFDLGEPANRGGHPDTWTPGVDPYVEFEILDRKGRKAFWLEQLLNTHERCAIERALLEQLAKADDLMLGDTITINGEEAKLCSI